MIRLGALVVAVAACSSPYKTGAADLSGVSPQIQSAGTVSFEKVDGSGNTVLGWELQFFANGPGYDCLSNNADEVADLFLYTDQVPTAGSDDLATLEPASEINIVTDNPPTIEGDAAAHFSVEDIKEVQGVVMLTDVHINTSTNKMDRVEGTVNAAGISDSNGDTVDIAGNFVAPVCE